MSVSIAEKLLGNSTMMRQEFYGSNLLEPKEETHFTLIPVIIPTHMQTHQRFSSTI